MHILIISSLLNSSNFHTVYSNNASPCYIMKNNEQECIAKQEEKGETKGEEGYRGCQ